MIGITWNKEQHSVGHRKLDDQHIQLLSLINQLTVHQNFSDAGLIGEDKNYDLILEELKIYINEHLLYEETLLKQVGYEGLESEKESHQRFVNKMKRMSSHDGDTQYELVNFLTRWWDHHIMSEDMKYKPYIENQPID